MNPSMAAPALLRPIPAAKTRKIKMSVEMLLDWSPLIWLIAAVATLVAAIVRGFTGFGFALIAIAAVTILDVPAAVIPMVLLLDLAISLHMIPSVRRDINWTVLTPILVGATIGVPIGVALLAHLPADSMRIMIALCILIAVFVLHKGYRLETLPGPPIASLVGVAAGFLAGSVGMPGPIIVVFFLASPLAVANVRGSLVAFILMTDILTLAMMIWAGLVTELVILRAVVLLPVVLLGTALGKRLFTITDPETVRSGALLLLAILALGALSRVLLS